MLKNRLLEAFQREVLADILQENGPVEISILNRFKEVRGFHGIAIGEIGDGPTDAKNPVVGAGGQFELLHRVTEQLGERGRELDVFLDLPMIHPRVAGRRGSGKAFRLAGAAGHHAFADRGGGFSRACLLKVLDRQCGCFNMDVDPVEERAADPGPIALNLGRRAAGGASIGAVVTIRRRVHRGNEHERTGKGDFSGTAGDGDTSVFERLAENLKGGSAKFGELVEKEDPVVGKGDFSRSGNGAPTEESDIADRVVGGSERSLVGVPIRVEGAAGCGLDAEDLQKLVG